MSNENDKITQSTLYERFKEITTNLRVTPTKQAVFSLHELNCEQTQAFFEVTISLLREGIDFAVQKHIDRRLWQILLDQIDLQGKVKSIGPDMDREIMDFYNVRITFLKTLIKLVNENHPQMGQIVKENDNRWFLANLYCYTGELYEHLAGSLVKYQKDPMDMLKISDALFNKALSIYPFSGKYHFLIGTIMIKFQDTFATCCALLKALMAQQSYNCREDLNQVFETNRKHYVEWAKHLKVKGDLQRDIHLKAYMIYQIKLSSIIFTKIGFEELGELQQMFGFLQEYLKIIKTNVHNDHNMQYTLLLKLIQITNFGLHHNLSVNQLKTVEDIKDNDLVRESIKFVYGVYVNVLDFILKYLIQNSSKNLDNVPPQKYLQLVIPIIYYLYDQPLISTYLLVQYPQLNDKLAQIYWFARQSLNRSEQNTSEDLFTLQDQLNEQFHNYLYPFETPLLGYQCYTHVLSYFKKQYILVAQDDNLETTILFYVCEQIIQQLHGIQIGTASQIPIQWEEDVKKELAKQLIILDGMNVAMRFGQDMKGEAKFCSIGLKIALEYWLRKGHECLIILPDFCFNEGEITKKREQNRSINKMPDDVKMLIEIKSKGYASGVPNWNYDDSYMIQHARSKGGLIMTNDRYNDHIKSLDGNIIEREKLKEWIRNNCISYSFLQNELVPNPDFLKRI